MIKSTEIAFLAGLLEGEGCFSGFGKRPHLRVDYYTTDQDMAQWAGQLTHKKVYGPYRPSKASANTKTIVGKKPIWGVVLQGARAAGVMMSIYQFLSIRNKARVKAALCQWRARKLDAGNLTKLRNM